MDEFILEWLEEVFGNPCEYDFCGESAFEVIDADGEFCNDNCGIPAKDCWKRYFEQLRSRKNCKIC
jgi:hypothetical protein